METLTAQSPIRIGELMVLKKMISVPELEACLALQHDNGKRLGEIVVEKNLVDPPKLNRLLQEQEWRNKGFWVID